MGHLARLGGSPRPARYGARTLAGRGGGFLRTYAHLYPGDLGAVADAMDGARSAVVDGQQQSDEGTPNVRAPNSVVPNSVPNSLFRTLWRVDFAGMARRRRQEAERHGL